MRVLVTRAAEDAELLATAIGARGHEPVIEPLLVFEAMSDAAIPLSPFQAVLATSRQAIRALEGRPADLARLKSLPLYAVGAATADLARAEGFADVHAAAGTATDLALTIALERRPGAGALLQLAGEDLASDMAGDLRAAGFEVATVTVYRMRAAMQLTEATRAEIAAGRIDAVTLMSPRTAVIWAHCVAAAGLSERVGGMRHLCLSVAVGRALDKLAPRDIRCAARPTRASLLDLLTD